jgi:hypothetical protein
LLGAIGFGIDLSWQRYFHLSFVPTRSLRSTISFTSKTYVDDTKKKRLKSTKRILMSILINGPTYFCRFENTRSNETGSPGRIWLIIPSLSTAVCSRSVHRGSLRDMNVNLRKAGYR